MTSSSERRSPTTATATSATATAATATTATAHGAPTDPRQPRETPLHTRTIELDVYERDGDFEIVGRLRDDRPWAAGTDVVEHLHDMELRVTVRRADLTIVAAQATMRRFPHFECPAIEEAFKGLVGLRVGRGYTRAVQERFGRALGCTHLEFLARAIGPVVVQAIPSAAARMEDRGEAGAIMAEAGTAWLADTCHVWATEGPGPQKIALGWRPGTGGYPAPSVDALRHGGPQAVPGEPEE